MSYETVFEYLMTFAAYKVHGWLLCRLLAPVALVFFGAMSRYVTSYMMKGFAIAIFFLLYYLPDVVKLYLPTGMR